MPKLFLPSFYWLFLFIPITFVLEHLHVQDSIVFFACALAILPIAKLIGDATENLAHHTGDAVGGLLNATFGNAPELIIGLVALKAGYHQMVLASLVGAILANLLLATGVGLLLGGRRFHLQEYNPVTTRVYSSMMFISVLSMIIPSAFGRFLDGQQDIYRQNEASLNIVLAISLLCAYGLYLIFMIKTHPEMFASAGEESEADAQHESHQPWSITRAILVLVGASIGAAFMSEVLVGAAEGTGKQLGMSSAFIGVVFVAVIGGSAESLSAIRMAMKNKVDLTMSIAMGSSIQIALFVAPVFMLCSLFIGPSPMFLAFSKAETGCALLAVILASVIVADGESHWFKGIQLITVYLLIAMLFYFVPEQVTP